MHGKRGRTRRGFPLRGNTGVIPETAKRLSGIHDHGSLAIARLVVMDSGLRPSAGPRNDGYSNSRNSCSMVGKSSATVGWMCIARAMTV